MQSPDEKNEINFPIIFKKHAYILPTVLKSAMRLKSTFTSTVFTFFFSSNQLEASDRRDTAVSPEKMIINYFRNNRKKYFFQGREIGKIKDTNICFLHGPMRSHSSKYDSNCRTALTTPLPKVIQSFLFAILWLQEFIPLSLAIFYPATCKHTLN